MSLPNPYPLPAAQNTVLAERLKEDYRELHHGPDMVRVSLPFGGDGWMAVRYDVVRQVLNDPRFSVEKTLELDDYPRIRQAEKSRTPTFTQYDGPRHTEKRGVLMKYLTVKRVQTLRPRTEEIVGAALREFEATGNPADLSANYARVVPLRVLCELLGTPPITDPEFMEAARLIGDSRAETPEQAAAAQAVIAGYFAELADEKRRNPGDDLVSALISDTGEGKWTEDELKGIGSTLLGAGHDATASMLAGILDWLSHTPALYERLRAEPTLFPRALEEFFRYVGVGLGVPRPRIALEDVQVGDVLVKEGEAILGNTHAADFDDLAFPGADRLDVDREPDNTHMAFGFGPHACLGAQLARMEIGVAVRAVLSRYKTLINVDSSEDWRASRLLKGPTEMFVTWELA